MNQEDRKIKFYKPNFDHNTYLLNDQRERKL